MTRRSKVLLAFLVLHRKRLHSRTVLTNLLWADHNEAGARKSLRTALWRLRSVLDRKSNGAGSYLVVHGDELGFNTNADFWLDVAEFESRLSAVETGAGDGSSQEGRRMLAEAVDLYRGDLLEGAYDEWCLYERDRLQSRFLLAMERLLQHELRQGDRARAIALGQRILSCDPLHEQVYRDLMRCYDQMGNRSAALRQYQRCARLLKRELDVEPMAETTQLYSAIRDGRRQRPPGVPTPASGSASPSAELPSRFSKVATDLQWAEHRLTEAKDYLEKAAARWRQVSGS